MYAELTWNLVLRQYRCAELLRTDGFYLSPPKNCETLYPENMPVFYNLGIFTTTATDCLAHFMNVKEVKESRNRPGVDQRVPGGLGSWIS